jgi:hypothetical protein
LTIVSFVLRCTCPNQLNLWALMWLIMFLFVIRLLNSSFVLVLHVPSLSFVGLNILLNIFLSIIDDFHFIDSFSTHISLAYVITVLIIAQYNFNLAFFDTSKLLHIF